MLLLIAATLWLQSSATIDRLVAVVGTEPIFQSDVRDVIRLRLLDPEGSLADPAGSLSASPGAAPASDEARTLERLINRRLVLAEVARYSQAAPSAADVELARNAWALRFDELPPHDPALVRAFIIETLRIERYIDQRFTAAAQPTREEARAFHQANHLRFMRDGLLAPFEAVEEDARRMLAEDRRMTMVRDWLRGLRDRAQVRITR